MWSRQVNSSLRCSQSFGRRTGRDALRQSLSSDEELWTTRVHEQVLSSLVPGGDPSETGEEEGRGGVRSRERSDGSAQLRQDVREEAQLWATSM